MAQAIRDELIEALLQGYHSPQDLLGEDGRFRELRRRLLERALGAELSEHLGYEKGDPAGRGSGNSRNGYSSKTMIGEDGAVEIAVPRDRNGSFEPQIAAKGQTRLDGFDDRIISLYARGPSGREIQAHLRRSRLFGQLPGRNSQRPVAGCWFHPSPKSNSSCLAAGCSEACGQPPTC